MQNTIYNIDAPLFKQRLEKGGSLYVDVSIWSGSSGMLTSKRDCTAFRTSVSLYWVSFDHLFRYGERHIHMLSCELVPKSGWCLSDVVYDTGTVEDGSGCAS